MGDCKYLQTPLIPPPVEGSILWANLLSAMETKGDEDENFHDSNCTRQESQALREIEHVSTESKDETLSEDKHSHPSPVDNLNENAKTDLCLLDVQSVVSTSNSTTEPHSSDSQNSTSSRDDSSKSANRVTHSSSDSSDEQRSSRPSAKKRKIEMDSVIARNNAIIDRFFNPPSEGEGEEPPEQRIILVATKSKRFHSSADGIPFPKMKNPAFKRNPFLKYCNYKYCNSPPAEDRIEVGHYERTSISEGPPGYAPCVVPKMPPPSYGAVSRNEDEPRPGVCPACKIGLVKVEYSYATLIFFCCLPLSCGKYKKCQNCGAYF